MNWFQQLFMQQSIAQAVVIYGLVIAVGAWLGRIKIFGISLGVTWILFMGLLASYLGVTIDKEVKDFLRDFGLILFVYCIGLQVGPGFWASLKKNAYVTNGLAALIVGLGILITIILFYTSRTSISTMTGIMSGAVTNTPGLGAAQGAANDLHLPANTGSFMALAYALVYPFGVFGIIFSLLIIKWVLKVDIDDEIKLHTKWNALKAEHPIAIHLKLENKQLNGLPLKTIFELIKEHIVISRMFHDGEIFAPTPATILHEGDVLLVIAPNKIQINQLKLLIGSESDMDLKEAPGSELISRMVVVTRPEVTHKRLGDIAELQHQHVSLTRLMRAGIEMVPNGNVFLQLGDNIRVVGNKDGVEAVAKALGNSLKRLEVPDLAPVFMGIVLGAIVGSIPIAFPNMPIPVKIGLAGGPLIVALFLSKFGNVVYLNNYTTNSANLIVRELGITLFLASVGLGSGGSLAEAFHGTNAWMWVGFGIAITMIPLVVVGLLAHYVFRKTYFEICGLLSGASTDPPALAFSMQMAKSDVPSLTYATVYPLSMILRIIGAQLLVLLLT